MDGKKNFTGLEVTPSQEKKINVTGWEDVEAMADNPPYESEAEEPKEDNKETQNFVEPDGENQDGPEKVNEKESLPDRVKETMALTKEVKEGHSGMFEAGNLMVDFGMEGVSKECGLEETLSTIVEEYDGILREGERPKSLLERIRDDGNYALRAVAHVYYKLIPNPERRKEVFADMVSENDNKARRLDSSIKVKENGELMFWNSRQGWPNGNAYDGLRAVAKLVGQVNNPDSRIFGDNFKQAEADGISPIAELVKDIENPTMCDFLVVAGNRITECAKLADEQIEEQKKEVAEKIDEIEKEVQEELKKETGPLEELRAEALDRIIVGDAAAREVMVEASQKANEDILKKTMEAGAKFDKKKQEYCDTLGEGVIDYLTKDSKKIKVFAKSRYDRDSFSI